MTQIQVSGTVTVELVDRISTKTNKPYTAIEVKIGEQWTRLIFPRNHFEIDYLKDELEKAQK